MWCRVGVEVKQKFGINELTMVKLLPLNDNETNVSSVSPRQKRGSRYLLTVIYLLDTKFSSNYLNPSQQFPLSLKPSDACLELHSLTSISPTKCRFTAHK